MDDLISRQAAIKKLDGALWGKEWDKVLAKTILEKLPTAEKRGKWVEVYLEGQLLASRCTACGELETGVPLNYCPWCGARMTEENDG